MLFSRLVVSDSLRLHGLQHSMAHSLIHLNEMMRHALRGHPRRMGHGGEF